MKSSICIMEWFCGSAGNRSYAAVVPVNLIIQAPRVKWCISLLMCVTAAHRLLINISGE